MSFPLTIDTQTPDAPVFKNLLFDTGVHDDDLVTSSHSPGFAGTAEPLSMVLAVGKDSSGKDVEFFRVQADANGIWSYSMKPDALEEGEHISQFRSLDLAGNMSDKSGPITVRVDSIAPAKALGLVISPKTGTATDGIALTNQPTVVFSGSGEAGASVEVRLNGNLVDVIVAGTLGWSIGLNSLAEGDQSTSVKLTDLAGNKSELSNLTFRVDVTAPEAPSIDRLAPDSGLEPNDGITNATKVGVSGRAEPAAFVSLKLDGILVGTVLANTTGAWEFAFAQEMAQGTHRVLAVATDNSGNKSSAVEFNFEVDTTAPAAPVIDRVSPDTGVDGDGIVNRRAISLHGRAEPWTTVEVFRGNSRLGTALANAAGKWTLNVATPVQSLLVDGSNELTARATDLGGNTGQSSAKFILRLDLTLPEVPQLVQIDKDTGQPGDLSTSDNQPFLKGVGEAFATIEVLLNGTKVDTVVADPLGVWSLKVSLTEGGNAFSFKAIDVAGNQSALSDSVVVTLNTVIPPVPSLLGFTPNSGNNLDWVTSAVKIVLQGSASPEVMVVVLVEGKILGETKPDLEGKWTFEVPGNLAEGSYRVQVRSVSLTGVQSALSEVVLLEIDPTAPKVTQVVVTPQVGSQPGYLNLGLAIRFSESVSGFDASKLVLPSGLELVSFTGSGLEYQAVLQPLAEATYTVVAGQGVRDLAGNNLTPFDLTFAGDLANEASNGLDLVLSAAGEVTYQGLLDKTADEDWFSVPVTGVGLEISVSGVTNPVLLEWFNESGVRLASALAKATDPGILRIQPLDSARHLRISGFAKTPYTLTAKSIDAIIDPQGENFGNAQVLNLNENSFSASGERTTITDLEYMRIGAPKPGWIDAVAKPDPASKLDIRLTAYDDQGKILAFQANAAVDGSASVRFYVLADRTYFLRVGGSGDELGLGGTGSWILSGNLTPDTPLSVPPPPPPPNLFLDATGKVVMRGTVKTGVEELVNFDSKTTGNYLIRMVPRITATGLVPQIYVFGENLETLGVVQGLAGAPLTLNVPMEAMKTARILFVGLEGTTGEFDATIVMDDYGILEGTAGQIPEQAQISGKIELVGDSDLLRFPITQTGLLKIVIRGIDGLEESVAFAAALDELPTQAANLKLGRFAVVAGQELFLRAEGLDGATGNYRVELAIITDDNTDLLDPSKAAKVTLKTPLFGVLETYGDQDVFTWTSPADEDDLAPYGAYKVLVSPITNANQVDFSLKVYRVDGEGVPVLIAIENGSGSGIEALVEFQAFAGTTYLFATGGDGALENRPFQLNLLENRLAADDDIPNSFQLAEFNGQYQLGAADKLAFEGAIEVKTDQDIVRFVASSTGQWIFKVDASPGSKLNPYLSLHGNGPTYSEIASDDDSGPGAGSLIVGNLVEGEAYFLSIQRFQGLGAYAFSAKAIVVKVEVIKDDYPATQFGVLENPELGPVTMGGTVDFGGDTDTFVLDWPVNTEPLKILAKLTPKAGSAIDPYLELVDSNGTILFQNDNAGKGLASALLFDVQPGQRLFLRASGFYRTLGDYELSLSVVKPVTNNDDYPGTIPLAKSAPELQLVAVKEATGASVTVFAGKVTGVIGQLGDSDIIRVVAPAAGFLGVKLVRSSDSKLNPFLVVYATDATTGETQVRAADDDSGGGRDSHVQIPVLAHQEVYLQATGSMGTIGAFSLQASFRIDDIGDLPAFGANLRLAGLRSSAGGLIESAEDKDLFLYQPTQSGTISVALNQVSGTLNPYLFISRASDGSLISRNNDASATNRNSLVEMPVEAGETYWIVATSAGGTRGEYALLITPIIDDLPSVPTKAKAFTLAEGNLATITGTIEAMGDIDWLRIVPVADGVLKLRLSGDGESPVDPTLAVFTDSDQSLGLSDDTTIDGKNDPSSALNISVRAGKVYRISVSGYGESTGGWKLDISSGSDVVDDYGNTFDTAELLEVSLEGVAGIQGDLGAGDQDVVRFLAPGDANVVINIMGTSGELRAFVRDSNGTLQVASGVLAPKADKLQFMVTTGQEVFLFAVAPEDISVVGGVFSADISFEKLKTETVRPVSNDVVSVLDNTLAAIFTEQIVTGETDEDFEEIRDTISSSLTESLLAALGGDLTMGYVIFWFDPVDFVITDSASQQIGNTGSQGAIRENASATLSQKGALDLVIIPASQAGTFSMQLYGVGGGRVLAGASMVRADGTVVNPTVTINGSVASAGVPVGSVSKEGLTLNLDFRGEQVISENIPTVTPTTEVSSAAISNTAQQVVSSLLMGTGAGAGNVVAGSLAEGISHSVTDLLVLLVGDGTTNVNLSSEDQELLPLVWETPEGKKLVALVNTFAKDIKEAITTGARLFPVGGGGGPIDDMLALLHQSMEALGFEEAQTILDRMSFETKELFSTLMNGPIRKELLDKPIQRLLQGIRGELQSLKAKKVGASAAKVPAKVAALAPETLPKTPRQNFFNRETTQGLNLFVGTRAIDTTSVADFLLEERDQVWLSDWKALGFQDPAVAPVQVTTEKTSTNDRFWGLLAAGLLAPSWVRNGQPATRTRSRNGENPLRLPENPLSL
ncbi:MAG: Ig-like domain-containing protein [Planctomycetota bacterium]|nr:Ig-like domain-containing protein [Planctomycetota bacterium]